MARFLGSPSLGDRYVDVDRSRVWVRVVGEGPPLLLVNGAGANIEMLSPLVSAFQDAHQVIAFDLPGMGRSAPAHRPLRISTLARLARLLLDQLELERVHVLGSSFGGAVAQQLVHDVPERVDRLVLAATQFGVGSVPGNPLAMVQLMNPHRFRSPALIAATARLAFGGRVARDPEALRNYEAARRAATPHLASYYNQMLAISAWTSLPWLHTISRPTLVIVGDDDHLVPLVNTRVLASRIPGAQLHVLRGAGHLMVSDQAQDVANVVRPFLGASPR